MGADVSADLRARGLGESAAAGGAFAGHDREPLAVDLDAETAHDGADIWVAAGRVGEARRAKLNVVLDGRSVVGACEEALVGQREPVPLERRFDSADMELVDGPREAGDRLRAGGAVGDQLG